MNGFRRDTWVCIHASAARNNQHPQGGFRIVQIEISSIPATETPWFLRFDAGRDGDF